MGDHAPDADDETLDAGPLATWWRETRAAIDGEADARVPCGTCTGCCEASQFIHLTPDDTDAMAHIPRALRFPAPGLPRGHQLMGYDEHGRCPMLVDGACSIYEHRPRTCRTYDCRIFAATGITPDGAPTDPIPVRVRRWRFEHPTPSDDDLRTALLAAAAMLERPDDELPDELRSRSATRRAVLAVETAVAFLGPEDASGRRPSIEPSIDEVADQLRR